MECIAPLGVKHRHFDFRYYGEGCQVMFFRLMAVHYFHCSD